MKGKLIVIEGTDGSGKATQANLLLQRLTEENVPVRIFDFPRYEESVYGDLVGRLLTGEFGDFISLSPYISSLPYTLDRAGARDSLRKALTQGHVICNRYTSSNLAHHSAKLRSEDQDTFISFVETGEFDELGLPRPALVIFLDVPTDVAYTLVGNKQKRVYLTGGSGRDQHEKDISYLENVRAIYKRLVDKRSDWFQIECVEDGELLSKENIHKKVYEVVKDIL